MTIGVYLYDFPSVTDQAALSWMDGWLVGWSV